MNISNLLIVFSSFSFLVYGVAYFTSPHMKNEFKRFGLEQFGLITVILELAGALGLIVGLVLKPLLLLSSGGLAVLMFMGVIVRIKMKDSLLVTSPALFFMLLNAFIFFKTYFS